METYTVSFFGHRQFTDAPRVERRLEAFICRLLREKDYVEFLVGREREFDLLVASVIRRCKREVRGDNSALVWVLPYETADYRKNREAYRRYYDEIEICEAAARGHCKNAYKCRNRIMVNRSDLVLFCVQHPGGGAWEAMAYAAGQSIPYHNLGIGQQTSVDFSKEKAKDVDYNRMLKQLPGRAGK